MKNKIVCELEYYVVRKSSYRWSGVFKDESVVTKH